MYMYMDKPIDDIQLIQCVKERPELYDSSHIRYMDNHHKGASWNDIAHELEADSSTCKARWANIRDNFRKSLRKSISKRSRGEKTIKHYKYADQLEFLKKYFDVEQTADNVGTRFILPEVEVKEEYDSSVQVDIQEPLSEDDDSQLPLYTIQKRRKTMQDSNDRVQCSANSSPRQSTQNFDIQHGENDEQVLDAKSQSVDTFLAALAPSLKTLSAINWHHAKAEIFAVVQKYELKTILGENSEKKT